MVRAGCKTPAMRTDCTVLGSGDGKSEGSRGRSARDAWFFVQRHRGRVQSRLSQTGGVRVSVGLGGQNRKQSIPGRFHLKRGS